MPLMPLGQMLHTVPHGTLILHQKTVEEEEIAQVANTLTRQINVGGR